MNSPVNSPPLNHCHFLHSKQLFSDHSHLVHANLSLSTLLMFIVYCISIGAAGGTLNRVKWGIAETADTYNMGWVPRCTYIV